MAEAGLFIRLYLDEDVTDTLVPALRQRGYGAQTTAEAGNLGASDEDQLAYAADQGMAILTYNIDDFVRLAREWHFAGREHAGILVSQQFSRREFGGLLRRLLRFLNSLTAAEIHNQIVFLQHFKP